MEERKNLQRYRQRLAREELSSGRSQFTWWKFAFGAAALLVHGAVRHSEPHAWAFLAGGVALGFVAFGLRGHHAWARWLAAAVFAGGALGLVLTREHTWWALHALVGIGSAIVLVLPSTGRLFALARGGSDGAAARVEEVPR